MIAALITPRDKLQDRKAQKLNKKPLRTALQHTRLHSKLWTIRIGRHITQQALAEKTGISRQALHTIETGKSWPTLLVALRIAQALELPIEKVFSLK